MKNYFTGKHIRGDFMGGITAGVVALPLALAFGASSGLGAAYGLYGAIFIGFFAALFGGTQTQISGPTAPMTAVSMVVVAGIVAVYNGDVSKALPVIMVVFLLAGLLQILMGLLGLGGYIKYIPNPVVSGFMTAIGVLILFGESFNVLGYYPQNDQAFVEQFIPEAEENLLGNILQEEAQEGLLVLESFEETIKRSHEVDEDAILSEATSLAKKSTSGVIGKIKHMHRAIANSNSYELLLALLTIFIVYGFKRITTKVPSTLVSLVVVTILAVLLNNQLNYKYVSISQIPSGFPMPFLNEMINSFRFSTIQPFIGAAISLAFLGAIDSLLTSVVADNLTKTSHKPNQELIGQGIGNSIAAIFKGIPGAGATIRTVVNVNAGGKTRLSGMIAASLLLVISLFISEAASLIPKAVLSGILITVGIGVMDRRGLKAIPFMEKDITLRVFGKPMVRMSSEMIIMFVVLIVAVLHDLIFAVGLGLIFAAFNFMKKMGDITAKDSTINPLMVEDVWEDEEQFPVEMKEEVYVKHLDGPLFFGYVSHFHELASSLPQSVSYIIFRMDKIPYIDQSGLYALEKILLDFKTKNKQVVLVGTDKRMLLLMRRFNLVPKLVSDDLIFDEFDAALQWLKKNLKINNY